MSVWQFTAAVGGYIRANTPEDAQGLTTSEAAELSALVDEPAVWH